MHYLKKPMTTLLFLVLAQAIPGWSQDITPDPKPAPCSTSEYHQFDFWIGEWEVKDAKGVLQGHNVIRSIEDACGLEEHWKAVTGSKGTSYNFYDQARKVWHQTWVDGNGGALFLEGTFANGTMSLSGKRPGQDGKEVLHRIQWTLLEDGRVKQHWQFSKDEGKTWADAFLGFYKSTR